MKTNVCYDNVVMHERFGALHCINELMLSYMWDLMHLCIHKSHEMLNVFPSFLYVQMA